MQSSRPVIGSLLAALLLVLTVASPAGAQTGPSAGGASGKARVGPKAPVCGTHEHHQFSSGYACNSPYDPEPLVPSKCPIRVFEVLVPILLIPASPGIWGVVGTTVVIEAGAEKVVDVYGWIENPRGAIFGEIYQTFREPVCQAFGYSS